MLIEDSGSGGRITGAGVMVPLGKNRKVINKEEVENKVNRPKREQSAEKKTGRVGDWTALWGMWHNLN